MKLQVTAWCKDGVLVESVLEVRDGLPEVQARAIVEDILEIKGSTNHVTAMDLHRIWGAIHV